MAADGGLPPAPVARTRPTNTMGRLNMKKGMLTGLALGLGLAMTGAAQAQVKLGVAGPITGPNAAFGAQLKNGAEQAVEDINAAGGIMGQKIVLTVGDDASDPKQGVSLANKFVSDGVKLVVGHFNSGVSIPASEVYQEGGIVQITPASTNPRFTERGMWNTFRTCGRDDQQGAVAGTFLADKFKGKKVAVVTTRRPTGRASRTRPRRQ
jgi:branched-chain amino acid transport system substrate-binding protein